MADLTFLKKFTKGNETKMKKYIGMYLKIAPDIFKKMENNIKNKDWESLRINAHSLKPQAEFMGLPELKLTLEKIEEATINNSHNGINKLYDAAYAQHIKAIESLSNIQFD